MEGEEGADGGGGCWGGILMVGGSREVGLYCPDRRVSVHDYRPSWGIFCNA